MMDKRTQKYTANITMGSALKEEARTILQQVHVGNSNERIKQQVSEEDVLRLMTEASRTPYLDFTSAGDIYNLRLTSVLLVSTPIPKVLVETNKKGVTDSQCRLLFINRL